MVLVSERAAQRHLRVRHRDHVGWSYPIGTWLNEIVGGWKYHAIVDKIGPRVPLEFAKIWRVAQSRTDKPVKFGTIAADLASTVLTVRTDVYDDDKRELMWDLAGVLNAELRQLVAAGCKVVQIEEPAIHSAAAWGADEATLDFYVDLFNYTVEGLDEAEIWVHTCWGNPGAQHCFQPSITYEASLEIYLERINADVWTIESKHNGHQLLPHFDAVQGEAEQEDRRRDDQPSRAAGRAVRTRSRRTFGSRSSTSSGAPRALVGLWLRPPGSAASDRVLQGRGARPGSEHRPRRARRCRPRPCGPRIRHCRSTSPPLLRPRSGSGKSDCAWSTTRGTSVPLVVGAAGQQVNEPFTS